MTNAEARFNKSLRPRKPEGSLGRTARDVHLDSHTAPELCWSRVIMRGFILSSDVDGAGIASSHSSRSSSGLGTPRRVAMCSVWKPRLDRPLIGHDMVGVTSRAGCVLTGKQAVAEEGWGRGVVGRAEGGGGGGVATVTLQGCNKKQRVRTQCISSRYAVDMNYDDDIPGL